MPATPHYVAPEVLVGNAIKRTGKTWRASDMWSMGVMLYQTLTNVYPFDDPDQQQLLAKVMAAEYTYPESTPNISGAARDLIAGLLEEDLSKRLTAQEMLAHPWFAALGASPPIPAPPAGAAFVTPQATPQPTPRSSIQLGAAGLTPSAGATPQSLLPPITESSGSAATPAPTSALLAAAATGGYTLPPTATATPAPAPVVAIPAVSLVPSPGHPNPPLTRRNVASIPREYKVVGELIDGNFEVSYLQDVNDTTRYAMKIIKKGSKQNATKFEKEYNALKLLMTATNSHVNIVPLVCWCCTLDVCASAFLSAVRLTHSVCCLCVFADWVDLID